MRKKYILAKLFDSSGLFYCLSKTTTKQLIVINYHRIYAGSLSTDFDEEVFGPSVEEFEAQMTWLAKNTACLSEDDVVDFVQRNKQFPKRSTLITFDDGYIDNYELAVPILSRLNIPAIFFIPVEAIEKRRLGWWDIIAYFVKQTEKKVIDLYDKKIYLSGSENRRAGIDLLLDLMKRRPFTETKNLLQVLSRECAVPFPTRERQSSQLMSWQQLKEIRKKNVSIGSHTYSHRTLSTLSEEQQAWELKKSKEILEEKIGYKMQSVGYPVGNYTVFTLKTKEIARQCGYTMGFSFNTGINEQQVDDPFNIKRIVVPNELPLFKGTLLMYSVFKERYDPKFTDVFSSELN